MKPRVCSNCGIIHKNLPQKHKITDMGTWFDCTCKNTLLIPSEKTLEAIRINKLKKAS